MNDNPTDTPGQPDPLALMEMTAEIVAAYVAHNSVPSASLPGLIGEVHAALLGLGKPAAVAQAVEIKPAVAIGKSITPDYLVCLDDGRKFKSLKRHLQAAYGLSPEQYRAKWGLPTTYPMVAPNYSAARSTLAKDMGLGNQRRTHEAKPAAAAA